MDAGAEDAVFYSIYPDWVAEVRDESNRRADLERLRVECLAVAAPIVQNYIWQHTQFDLQVSLSPPPSHRSPTVSSPEMDEPTSPAPSPSPDLPLLHGRTRYGHNLDDEWFVVHLLFEITRKIPHISSRVWDSDGEFLLIEAAYAIPRWLKPENSHNRVFIRQGEVHILPLPVSPADVVHSLANPSLLEALRVLGSEKVKTRASEDVQAAVRRKVQTYPEHATRCMHRVRCRVPVKVAEVLKQEPQMVSLAVEAFYTRDHDAMAAASRMERFGSGGEMVTVLVCMSRAMYAQLKQQVFQAPRGYPAVQGSSQEDDIGVKLAVGFEMMYWECSRFQEERASLSGDAGWLAFRRSLESSGYFRGLLEGSREHRELLNKAVERYRETESFSRIRMAMQAPAKRVDEILAMDFSSEDFQNLNLPASDDDSWLYGGDEELTNAMEERQKEMDEFEKQRRRPSTSSNQDFDPSELTRTMQSFVEKMSSFEGAEVPSNEEPVSLDMGKFFDELRRTLDLADGHDHGFESDDSSDMIDSSDSDEEHDIHDKGKAPAEAEDEFMEEYSDALQQELKKSSMSKTFAQAKDAPAATEAVEDSPVHVDFNLLNNLLESYSSQQGLPGPASNILGMMGMQLPDNLDEDSKRKTVRKSGS